MLSEWQIKTNNKDKLHPKCKGKECGSYEICEPNRIMIFGCIHYDYESENQMIEEELK